jgi:hypothetical protein
MMTDDIILESYRPTWESFCTCARPCESIHYEQGATRYFYRDTEISAWAYRLLGVALMVGAWNAGIVEGGSPA